MAREAEDRSTHIVYEKDRIGEVKIADEVVAIIAGLAATEVDGVDSMAGNITNELVGKLGMKNLSKGVKVTVTEDHVVVDLSLNMKYGYILAVTGVTAETAEAILNTLASMGKVDKELWESCRVIWVQSLLENLRQLYSKRTAAPTKPSVDNFPGRRVESPAQEPAAATEAEGTPPAVPEPAPEEHDKPKAPRRKAGSLSAEQAERFDRFYAAYPKKVDRATAERAWAKINPEPDDAATDRIIAAVEAAKKYDSRFRERQFTPNPASWLNAKGYMNDYTGGEQRGNADGYAGFTPSGGFGSFG